MKIGLLEKEDFYELNNLISKFFLNEKELEIITDPMEAQEIDILIIGKNNDSSKINFFIRKLKNNGTIILNIDEKISNDINFCNRKVISYGFNSNALVTASSVLEDDIKTVQCCVQKDLSTISGNIVEEQEFCVNAKGTTIYNILAAVATALVNDVEISKM